MHAQRLQRGTTVAYDRSNLINRVASRFYVNEPTVLVRNGLSTDLLCSPSDLKMQRLALLTEKIHDSMEYATAFSDVEELNALQYIAPSPPVPDYYLTLGLYLYFADECSRHCPNHTFLSALREAKVALSVDDAPDSARFYERCLKAFEILGLNDPKYTAILKEWQETGSYTIGGQQHFAQDGKVHGTYAQLARQICMRQNYLGMNLAISYALGNKECIDADSQTNGFQLARLAIKHPAIIGKRIARGFEMREEKILTAMIDALKPFEGYNTDNSAQYSASRAKDILAWLPDTALEILDRERTVGIYADAPTIGAVYPNEDLPGLSYDGGSNDVRENKGQWLKRYRTVFMANGYRVRPGELDSSPSLKAAVVAQTLLHETTHMALDALPREKRDALEEELKLLSDELHNHAGKLPLYFTRYLHTIDTNTLAEVLDGKSRLYTNYENPWEEVACNMYALMHTDFNGKQQNIQLSSEQPFTQPPPGLEIIAKASRHLSELMDEALVEIRKRPVPPMLVDDIVKGRLG